MEELRRHNSIFILGIKGPAHGRTKRQAFLMRCIGRVLRGYEKRMGTRCVPGVSNRTLEIYGEKMLVESKK